MDSQVLEKEWKFNNDCDEPSRGFRTRGGAAIWVGRVINVQERLFYRVGNRHTGKICFCDGATGENSTGGYLNSVVLTKWGEAVYGPWLPRFSVEDDDTQAKLDALMS